MKDWNVILGVDVSKKTLDVSCASRGLHIRISNDKEGYALLVKWCIEHGIDLKATLFILEYTGGYEYRFLQHCESKSYSYCRIPGLEIKRSLGMVRGKSDQSDSFRIGRYGEEKSSRLKADKKLDNRFIKLRKLLSFRKRLVRESAGYKATAKEHKAMYGDSLGQRMEEICREKTKQNKGYILEVEQAIMEIIDSDSGMKLNYSLLTSIKGIGKVNAWMTIVYTENFTCFPNGRSYAVYAGVIPFEHTSGTSIKGKKRVSKLANKEIKQELNQAAKTAITHDPEIRKYAQRKLERKLYGIVLNNVKFKLILRMFSLVKRGEKYVENYNRAA